MIASVFACLRKLSCKPSCAALGLGVLACVTAQGATAADCPGHPDAIGTSRTLVVDPHEHPIIGTMQYAKTLPLADHEVVLTFDDGPLPKYSNQILAILAAHCAKATFFLVGRQANANPEGVRKVRDAGHTVATHTQSHPSNMHRLPIDRAAKELDDGIASVTAALADGSAPAPFFRIPGLARADAMEEYAKAKGIQLWSADFPADDWRPVSSQRVYDLAMQRLEAKGKGILLLHDIQARTVAALPKILHELKARGYRIVHVVPATPERPATPTEPQQWQLHSPSETVAIARWPKIPNFVFAGTEALAAPVLSELDPRDAELIIRARRTRGISPSWPQWQLAQAGTATALPIPAASVFRLPEGARVTMLAAAPARRLETAEASARETKQIAKSGKSIAGKSVSARSRATASRQATRSKHAAHRGPQAGQAAPGHSAQTKKNARAVRVAGLKKRQSAGSD